MDCFQSQSLMIEKISVKFTIFSSSLQILAIYLLILDICLSIVIEVGDVLVILQRFNAKMTPQCVINVQMCSVTLGMS